MKFHGQRRKAQGSRIKDNEGDLGFSLAPFAVRPAPDAYASFLGICPRFAWTPHPAGGSPVSSRGKACGMDIFHQLLRIRFFDSLDSSNADYP
jgi:hypothetical protein